MGAPQTKLSSQPEHNAQDIYLLIVVVFAISLSAPLVRWSAASAIALAFWRTAAGSALLIPFAWRRSSTYRMSDVALLVVGGVALAAHFVAWFESLELTSVAASVTLVSTAPLMVALVFVVFGKRVSGATWFAVVIALVGIAVMMFVGSAAESDLTGSDLGGPDLGGSELRGNVYALLGAAAMAVYVLVGSYLQRRMNTGTYAGAVYAVAAASLLLVAYRTATPLFGFGWRTWATIGAMILGPQMLGHTVLNYLLRRISALSASLALLAEPVGASILVLLIFGEVPSWNVVVGAILVLVGLAIHLLAQKQSDPRSTTIKAAPG